MGPGYRLGGPVRVRSPRALGESVDIEAGDGVVLRAIMREPKGKLVGTAVLAHAMFARRSEFDRAGFAEAFSSRGWRTIAFDFRGHGDSDGKDAQYTYDDLALRDLPAVVAAARARSRKRPVVVVGHSLGGHVALASQGAGASRADAIVGIGSNLWLPQLEPSVAARLTKRAMMLSAERITERVGRYPARALRGGSDDACASYMFDLVRFTLTDAWRSRDGSIDYLQALARIDVPVYAIGSEGDRILARPACVRAMHARVPGAQVDMITRADDGSAPPGHMELVTTTAAQSSWLRAEAFLRQRLG